MGPIMGIIIKVWIMLFYSTVDSFSVIPSPSHFLLVPSYVHELRSTPPASPYPKRKTDVTANIKIRNLTAHLPTKQSRPSRNAPPLVQKLGWRHDAASRPCDPRTARRRRGAPLMKSRGRSCKRSAVLPHAGLACPVLALRICFYDCMFPSDSCAFHPTILAQTDLARHPE